MRVTVQVLAGGDTSTCPIREYEFTDVMGYQILADFYKIEGKYFGVRTDGYFPNSRSIVLII